LWGAEFAAISDAIVPRFADPNWRDLATALEHGNYSNREQDDQADGKRLDHDVAWERNRFLTFDSKSRAAST
jgi:hypothetical protein